LSLEPILDCRYREPISILAVVELDRSRALVLRSRVMGRSPTALADPRIGKGYQMQTHRRAFIV
jgi:hypothetical protein